MKILIAIAFPTQGSGSGTLVTTQAAAYRKAGHEVHILLDHCREDFIRKENQMRKNKTIMQSDKNISSFRVVVDGKITNRFPEWDDENPSPISSFTISVRYALPQTIKCY